MRRYLARAAGLMALSIVALGITAGAAQAAPSAPAQLVAPQLKMTVCSVLDLGFFGQYLYDCEDFGSG
jgi:hypothetical protein